MKYRLFGILRFWYLRIHSTSGSIPKWHGSGKLHWLSGYQYLQNLATWCTLQGQDQDIMVGSRPSDWYRMVWINSTVEHTYSTLVMPKSSQGGFSVPTRNSLRTHDPVIDPTHTDSWVHHCLSLNFLSPGESTGTNTVCRVASRMGVIFLVSFFAKNCSHF